jgi:NAD(P)-dependent dehydrogenase (short-subunit alcohol dehydrogenase family)
MKKLVIVTGSSKGIGEGVVQSFVKSGDWKVIGFARSDKASSERYFHLSIDLMSESAPESIKNILIQELRVKDYESVCVVHNFGMTTNASVLEQDLTSWNDIFYVNVTFPFLLTKELSPLMKPGSSHLYIGSTLSTMAVPNACAYVTSKHAVLGLMRATASDLAPRRIRANLVCPGFTETLMADDVMAASAQKAGISVEAYKESIIQRFPDKKMIDPLEIGKFVLYLAENPSLSGEIYHVNAGFCLV